MADFHPKATRVPGESAGQMVTSAPKITHHLTVGTTIDSAISAYRSHRGWPHITCDWVQDRLKIVQHLPLSAAARALQNPGSETNKADTIQIEHVGYPHAGLTPTLFEHVNPLGTYDFSSDRPVGELRPLRTAAAA